MPTTTAPPAAARATVTIADGLDGLDALREEWRALFESTPCEPSMSFEWTRALARTHVRDDDRCFLVLVRREGRLVGVVPLVGRAPRVFGVRHRLLRPLAELKNTHSDVLMRCDDADAIGAMLAGLRGIDYRWDSLRLSKLLEGHALVPALESGARAARCLPRRRYRKPAYWLPLPATFDEYFASRSAKFRNHARRAEKKLRAAGPLRERIITAPGEFDDGCEALVAIERASWKESHGTSMAASAAQTALYREWGRTAPPGHVHLQLLFLGDEPVAHNLGCVYRGTYYYLKTSYVAEYRPLGPATFLRLSLIRSLVAQGVSAIDFCGPPYEWEQQWAEQSQWHHVLSVYAPTARGRLLALADPWTHYSTARPVFLNEDPRGA